MRLTNLEIVKLLKPRLGFGSPDVHPEPEAAPSTLAPAHAVPEPIAHDDLQTADDTQLSLLLLDDELKSALTTTTTEAQFGASESLKELATVFEAVEAHAGAVFAAESVIPPVPAPEPKPESRVVTRTKTKSQPASEITERLVGCKVGAIGFGRQDIAGLATAMIERRARIEFLARTSLLPLAEFDLLLINAASAEILKREADTFREILTLGIPSIVIGSRAALTVLRDTTDPLTWDFASKPLHLDELVWRANSLLTRLQESGVKRRLPSRVVVADHDAFTRSLIESAMAQLGVECQSTEEGEAAWNAIEEGHPGAVILDLTLPNRDGFQLMADIRRAPGRKPKIIVLSARQSEADILRAFSLGADDYITKPFSPLELSARLSRLLGGVPNDHA